MASDNVTRINILWTTVISRLAFIFAALYCFTEGWDTAGGWMVFGAIVCGYSWGNKKDGEDTGSTLEEKEKITK
ncbi:hypothetical protein HUO09_17230 [Vibrio sp. Y2-5]|uniref:hypothetical protein n=1 Tax=Vibrio sp. Y2-5 TaxID=2743977 RepID=UPI001660F000|nr:hypothetical protein [Vibrio sp. Y2-5]MBD0788099.1 hypothetical protein [Vibrio sp. Y2-5]